MVNEIGEKIRLLREHKKILPKVLAATLDISVDVLGKYETGKLDNPTISTLKKFGDALGVSIEYFVTDYTPAEFFLRQDMLQLADKLSKLPLSDRNSYKRHIQSDYNDAVLADANRPVHERRSNIRNEVVASI